jgi:DNA (cytosine-5)-methyltransferase 1
MKPLIVDLFAGGGGASTGILQALGRSPDVARAVVAANA